VSGFDSFPIYYGPQFIAKDFKEFIRLSGMTHVRTSPHYPQSNGKLERFHKTLKGECIRSKTPLFLDDAKRLVAEYVDRYNTVRLHSAIGYIAPHYSSERSFESCRSIFRLLPEIQTDSSILNRFLSISHNRVVEVDFELTCCALTILLVIN
jgi:hypothetical protein